MATIPHLIIDEFLPNALHQALLAHALQVDDFAPGKVIANGQTTYQPDSRKGQLSNDRLGPHLRAFRAALSAQFEPICRALGMAPFDLATIEIRLAAHTDGDYFKPHRDTLTGLERSLAAHDRMITAVYYFHRQPKAFSGGELLLHPFSPGEPLRIEPRSNRLAVFPAFLLHQVLPVSVPSGKFADSRLSVSCWFDRDRTNSDAAKS
jgi:SM-20-related protein